MHKAEYVRFIRYIAPIIVGGIIGSLIGRAHNNSVPPQVVCPSEPDDAWIQRRLSYFEQACGPVPFEVKIWRKGDEEGIEGHCGRPEKIRSFVPKPKTSPSGEPTREGIAPVNKEM